VDSGLWASSNQSESTTQLLKGHRKAQCLLLQVLMIEDRVHAIVAGQYAFKH
jgi:hypothetical protein